MAYDFRDFCNDCRATLKSDPGPNGRQRIREHLTKLLADPKFVDDHVGDRLPPGKHLLFEDPELGFVVLGYHYPREGGGTPHNHGDSWAVYGQARDYTDVKVFRRKDDATNKDSFDLEVIEEIRMTPGHAELFDVGVIHSISFPAGSRVVRITGTDLDKIRKDRYDRKTGKVEDWYDGPSHGGR